MAQWKRMTAQDQCARLFRRSRVSQTMARRLCLLALSLLALAAPTSAALADPCPGSAADSGCQALGAFGNQPAPGQAILRQPQAVALDGVGNLLVGDRWSYAIQRF